MLSFTPLLTLLIGLGSPAPDLAPPPPAPAEPVCCRIEVRLRDVSENQAGRKSERLLARGTLEIQGGKARYRTGERTPVVTYSFDAKGWKAVTTFQHTGVTVNLLENVRAQDGARTVHYECDVRCILDVVGNVTPLFGEARWSGIGRLSADKPIVLTAISRVDGRVRRLPKNHPLADGRKVDPLPDLVTEIELRIELVPASR